MVFGFKQIDETKITQRAREEEPPDVDVTVQEHVSSTCCASPVFGLGLPWWSVGHWFTHHHHRVYRVTPPWERKDSHVLQQSTPDVESRGVCTSRDSREKPIKEAQTKEAISKESPTKVVLSKDNHHTKCQLVKENRHSSSRDALQASRRSSQSHRRHSCQELDAPRSSHGPRSGDLTETTSAAVRQELLHLSLARQALEAEKVELGRLLEQRESIITELRKQMHQRDKTIQAQRTHFEDALRNVQNGKRVIGRGESPAGGRTSGGGCGSSGGGGREELQLVREAIVSLRSNFRETDPNQHTLDTLEQAIAILIERAGSGGGGGGGSGGGSGNIGTTVNGTSSNDKASRPGDKRLSVNGVVETSTKVIYFTERTVTPFMSTINKRLGDIRLRDFKNMFDRPGLFRFHFKSHDPEYGMVKEEIVNDDDILPGVEGKIIAWVEEDVD